MTDYFVDTNIFLRHLLNDNPVLSPATREIVRAIEQGVISAWTSDLVVAELVFVLSSRKTYNLNPQEIADRLLPLISLPHLRLSRKRLYADIFALYTTLPIDFIDAYNAVLMQHERKPHILSFDTDFDAVPGMIRHKTRPA